MVEVDGVVSLSEEESQGSFETTYDTWSCKLRVVLKHPTPKILGSKCLLL